VNDQVLERVRPLRGTADISFLNPNAAKPLPATMSTRATGALTSGDADELSLLLLVLPLFVKQETV